jgi:oxygen-independent coproporphyrinogen-3 oxidase
MLGLYVHVPFCQSICSYCNFNRGLFDPELTARYVAALVQEIRAAGDGRAVDTIFFGGGTPSLLEPEALATILEACQSAFSIQPGAEVTLEANPETVSEPGLRAVLAAGVTRVSLGVQSFDAEELRRLGRIHSAARAVEAVGAARRAGCRNLSLDLMLWLPGQSRSSWHRTVDQAIALAPDHVSMYLLELYPNAPLKEAMARAEGTSASWAQAAEDDAADMYLEGLERFDAAGYGQYEISNVARPGLASRHNLKYWQSGDWRGFGPGAHSTVDGRRWQNVAATTEYIDRVGRGRPVSFNERELPARERAEEALFTGLRLSVGIARHPFAARFGFDPWDRYGSVLASYVDDQLMWVAPPDRFGLTRRGMLLANEILTTFV